MAHFSAALHVYLLQVRREGMCSARLAICPRITYFLSVLTNHARAKGNEHERPPDRLVAKGDV
jgi:hypothetical protein